MAHTRFPFDLRQPTAADAATQGAMIISLRGGGSGAATQGGCAPMIACGLMLHLDASSEWCC